MTDTPDGRTPENGQSSATPGTVTRARTRESAGREGPAPAPSGMGRDGEGKDDPGRALLAEAAVRFREYEAHHAAKGDIGSDAKARRNAEIAERIEAHLEVSDPEMQRLGEVWRSQPPAFDMAALNRVHGLALSLVQDLQDVGPYDGQLTPEAFGLIKDLSSFERLRDLLDALGEPAVSGDTSARACFFDLSERTVLTVNSPRGVPDTVEVNGRRFIPAPSPYDVWDHHPVDALKAIAARAGWTLDPEAEARMRAICDEPVPIPYADEPQPHAGDARTADTHAVTRKPAVEGLECTHQPGHRPDCECELCFPLVDIHKGERP